MSTKKTSKLKRKPGNPETPAPPVLALYERIRIILQSARASVARTVNTSQVAANWLIGQEIVEEEQRGAKRADYGRKLLTELSVQMHKDFGRGYSVDNLEWFRAFYLNYPNLLNTPKSDHYPQLSPQTKISDALRRKSPAAMNLRTVTDPNDLPWSPGILSPNLSWTHYRALVRINDPSTRSFYEIESIKNQWTARELERQINSLLYERLAKSKDKAGLMKLATKGQEITTPADIFKDPVVIEFLGFPESHRLVESNLETALINNLQSFLLELGKGFAFLSRQQRISLDGDHFYIDLVFYHTVLKCHVLIDLKVGKLTHADLGQMQLYVNYFDHERRTEGDGPTLGLILCTDKNDAVVKYLLGQDQSKKIFTSRYKLHLPTEAELASELKREVKELQ